MPYVVGLRHGEDNRYTSMIDALGDYMECIDNPPGHGAYIYWEDIVDRDIDSVVHSAAYALLWSESIPVVHSTDARGFIRSTREWIYGQDGEEGEDFGPADDFYTVEAIDAQSMANLRSVLTDFIAAAGAKADEWSDSDLGSDFILTANGHGTGFWDRGVRDGDALTELCKTFGEFHVYGGNGDGSISIEG